MQTNDLVLETADGPMACFQAEPQGETRGAVLVIQEAFGVNAHIQRRHAAGSRRSASTPSRPAFFHRAGGGAVEDYTDFAAIFPLFEGLVRRRHPHGRRRRARPPPRRRVRRSPRSAPSASASAAGRRSSWRSAAPSAPPSASTAAASPPRARSRSRRSSRRPGSLQTPWLGLFGDEDASIPVDSVEQLRGALEGATPSRPRSFATPAPATGSTAMPGPTTTRMRPGTPGTGPWAGSTTTLLDRLA